MSQPPAPAPAHRPSVCRFGLFEFDPAERQLRRGAQAVAATHKALAVLAMLVGRQGRLVRKTELFDTVWAGTVVTDAALSRVIRELRVALGDDRASPQYIATVHGLGFRFVAAVDWAADVVSQLDLPARVQLSLQAPIQAPLVGREAELAWLALAAQNAALGQRQLVFVTGEAGVGKTSLVQAFVQDQSTRSTVQSAQGRCIEQYGAGEPYLPFREALEQLSAQVGAQSLRAALLRYAPSWLAQLPWLALEADQTTLHQALADATAARMLRELAQALEALAAVQPIVLWLEDLHWSDPSSLEAIAFLAGRRDAARLMLVCSFRPGDAQANASPLHVLAHRLVQRGQARELALGPLRPNAVAAYLGQRFAGLSADLVSSLAEFIHRRTDGNALFTVAAVDDLVARGNLSMQHGQWVLTTQVSALSTQLPASLRQLLHHQFDRMRADDQDLIEAAAVAGHNFSAAAVAASLNMHVGEVERRCANLVSQGCFLRAGPAVYWPDGSGAAGFGFVHALYWLGIAERTTHSRRALWHARLALRQEQAFVGQLDSVGAELAMRFEAAGDFVRSLHYLQLAGASALQRCAYPECLELLGQALRTVGRLPIAVQAAQELAIRWPLGAALMAAQGYASGAVEENYQRALILGRVVGAPVEIDRALRGLWNVALVRAQLTTALTAAQELLVRTQDSANPGAAFDALAKLGQTCMHMGDFAAARAHLAAALALPSVAQDGARAREMPRVLAYLAWVLWYTGDTEAALQRADEALHWAGRVASPHSSAFALGFISWLHVMCGNLARAHSLAQQQNVLSAEHGILYWLAWSEFTLGLTQPEPKDPDLGLRRMSKALNDFVAMGAQVGVPHFLCFLAEAQLAAHRSEDALRTLQRCDAQWRGTGNSYHAAEAARLHGEALLLANAGSEAHRDAAIAFHAAVGRAREQGAHSLEQRALASLSRLSRSSRSTGSSNSSP